LWSDFENEDMRILKLFIVVFLLSAALHPAGAQDLPGKDEGFELFKQGVNLFNRRSYEAAIDFFRKTLGKSPPDERARFFLGMSYYKAGFNENALFEFNTVLQNDRGNEIIENFTRYLSTHEYFFRREKRTEQYTIGKEIQANPLGKYILSKMTGIDVDELGNIYAAGFGSKLALKISQEGKPLFAFTSPRISIGRVYDIVRGSDGAVYISDFTNDLIYKFNDEGRYLMRFGGPGSGDGRFYGPTALAIDGNGDLYVIDSGNVRVEKFSPQGEFLLVFGRAGDSEGEFRHPSGIAVDDSGNVYVADHGKKTVQIYDRHGNYMLSLSEQKLMDPYGLFFTKGNRLIVSDRKRLFSYDPLYSTWTEIETGNRLTRVLDTAEDRLGQFYTCDYETDSILQFVPEVDRYRNLNAILDRVDASNFPAIVYYVTVLDADGYPIYGLQENNFLLRFGGGVVQKVDLRYNAVRDSRLRILFLVDKSLSMEKYKEDVNVYLRQFISSVADEDEMAVVGFNSESWIASSFTGSRLQTLDAVLEDRYGEEKRFDKAFRMSIDILNKEFYKKAVVVVTDGFFDDDSFLTYSFESCMKYAANNHIPVYFLSFGGRENQRLDYFAKNTGGRFYDVLHSNEYPFLYNTIKRYRSPEYIVFFNDEYDPSLENLYLDAEVEVEYNTRMGKSRLGLIYP
jgi:DNA-binding beta-propeller fold protein YncE/Mg-chelatase subunit ChlD